MYAQLRLDLFGDECECCKVSTALYNYKTDRVYAYCARDRKYRWLNEECRARIIERIEP